MTSATPPMDAPLERLVRHVVEVMRPLEVWLFGSRAENRARPTSDYDLLVVMPDETPEAELDPVHAWRLGWEARVTADIVPCTRSEFDEEKDEIDSLPRAALAAAASVLQARAVPHVEHVAGDGSARGVRIHAWVGWRGAIQILARENDRRGEAVKRGMTRRRGLRRSAG